MIKDYYYREHKRNKDRIKYGIIAMVVIPIIFLILLFVVNSSKVIFLVMWIASLFIISGYLIAIEYKDYNMTENLKILLVMSMMTHLLIQRKPYQILLRIISRTESPITTTKATTFRPILFQSLANTRNIFFILFF